MKTIRERIIEEISDLPESDIPRIYKLLRFLKSEFLVNKERTNRGNVEEALKSAGVWKDMAKEDLHKFSEIIKERENFGRRTIEFK